MFELVIAGTLFLSVNGQPMNRDFSETFSVIDCNEQVAETTMAEISKLITEMSAHDVLVADYEYGFSCR